MSFDIKVPDGWTLVKLSDLGEVNRGRSRHRPRDAAHLYNGPYPFVQTGDVKASGGRITQFSQTYSEAGLAQSRLWPTGTMCITIAANIAETGILTFPACFPDSVIGFIADEKKCNVYFIEFVFRLLRKRIQAQATGSVQDNINLQTLERLQFPIPALDEQNRIAEILGKLDDKIYLNTNTNRTLEQIAQAIFKSWFVDFDPVKAKMNGEQPEGMDDATASLFPEKLVESELGLIPEGWSVQTIKSLSEKISKGTTPSKKDLASATDEPSIRFIKVKDIDDQGEILRGKLETIPESIHMSKLKRSILERDDILFSIAGTIGRVAIVGQDLDNVNTNQAVAFVRLKDKQTHLPLVYMSMRESRLQQKAISSIVQGVQANLSLANVGDMEVIVPPKDILNLWNKHYSSILQMIKNNFGQSRQLAVLRDTLLPKLLSGEIELEPAGVNAND